MLIRPIRFPRFSGSGKSKRNVAVVGHSSGKFLFGAERSLIDIVAAINRDSYNICCIIPEPNTEYEKAISAYVDSLHVFPYDWWHGSCPIRNHCVEQFISVFEAEKIDLVHVNTVTLLDPLEAAKKMGLRSIVHVRELVDRDPFLTQALGADPTTIVNKIKASADVIIANSEATHRLFSNLGRSVRLYNCIDLAAFDLPNVLESGILNIGIISSNGPQKGIEHFVSLASLCARKGLPTQFFVFGPETDVTARLKTTDASILENCHFAGYVDDPLDAFRQINVVASFSVVPESFGRTLAEGMAARRPVIAFDGSAVREFVRSGEDGFVIPSMDIERAMASVELLAKDSSLIAKMGKSGRKRAKQLFSPRRFSKQLNAIYAGL